VTLRFLDGNEHRAAELRRIVPQLDFELANLPVGFATAAPEPAQRARDMVLAVEPEAGDAVFAEAVDLCTLDGKSLRLELDTENDNRFCRWRRETPARMYLCVALRRGADVDLFAVECEGKIADQPAGPKGLGWDRLFIPDGFNETLAQLSTGAGEDPDPVGLRSLVYGDLAAALAAR
jgi:inosine/xanthosine triphosphate pyrophosphatase family protein